MSKKIIKEIINYVRTIQIYHYISKYNNIHSKLAYSNNVQKKEITLLCNGPSLKEVLPAVSKMSNQDFVVVNFFAFSEFFKQIKPRIYCLCDGMFFLNTPKNKRREEVLKLYKILNEEVNWNMRLIIPIHFFNEFKEFSKLNNSNIEVVGANQIDFDISEKKLHKLYKKNWACPNPQTVAIMAIYVSINSGYKTINLYGVDHTFTQSLCVNNQNQLCMKYEHFYDTTVELKPIQDALGNYPSFAHELQTIVNIFHSHEKLESYAKSVNCKIWNCTKGSFIDAYERRL